MLLIFYTLNFKELLLWPPKELVKLNMPKSFKTNYPSTRVILDATEIYIEQPHSRKLQQMTFSNYKNGNTYKELTYKHLPQWCDSSLFPGSISNKALTRESVALDLLEEGDSGCGRSRI